MQEYRTIQGEAEAFYEIQKSRFITHARHIETETEAQEFIRQMKKKYFDARHNCSAWVLGELGEKQKSNDDGEPGGTAGNPILESIKKKNLTNTAVVVTRYFGGIKLGAGGLIRAYGHAAILGLEAAAQVCMTPLRELRITCRYNLLATLENYLRQKKLHTLEPIYAENVTLVLLLPPTDIEGTLEDITNLTAANFTHELGAESLFPLPLAPEK